MTLPRISRQLHLSCSGKDDNEVSPGGGVTQTVWNLLNGWVKFRKFSARKSSEGCSTSNHQRRDRLHTTYIGRIAQCISERKGGRMEERKEERSMQS